VLACIRYNKKQDIKPAYHGYPQEGKEQNREKSGKGVESQKSLLMLKTSTKR